jgi:hypothetical protein
MIRSAGRYISCCYRHRGADDSPASAGVGAPQTSRARGVCLGTKGRGMSEPVKLTFEPLHDGFVRISITADEKTLSADLDQKESAQVAAKILESAAIALAQSGMPLENKTNQFKEWASIRPTIVGLGASEEPNHESLILQFGNAVLAFPIGKSELRRLGEALVALSADSDRSH